MTVEISLARPEYSPALAAIETSADRAFAVIPELAWIASGDGPDVEPGLAPDYEVLIPLGTVWIASNGADFVGFLAAQPIMDDLHVWELAVAAEHQRKGIGRRLIETAADSARKRDLASLTLTTFRSVPWNAPFYASMGFEVVTDEAGTNHLRKVIADEVRRGLPDRCAMRLML